VGTPLRRLDAQGGGYYGYKVHAAVDVATGLPLAWTVETASAAETNFALPLIDVARERGFAVRTAIMDKGYDNDGCMERDVAPGPTTSARRRSGAALRASASPRAGGSRPTGCIH